MAELTGLPMHLPAAVLQPVAEVRTVATPNDVLADQSPVQPDSTQTQPQAEQPSDAQPEAYPYLGVSVGVGFPGNFTGSFYAGPTLGTVGNQFELNPGFAGELAAGYKFPEARAELAVGYGNFATNRQTLTVPALGSATISGSGDVSYVSVLANGYYDFPTLQSDGSYSPWRPYIGAGIGYASVFTPACFGGSCFQVGNAGAFAYQGKVGLSYRAAAKGDLFLEGAYLGTTGFTVSGVNYDSLGAFRVTLGWRQGL